MKKGIVQTLLYYIICGLIFTLLFIFSKTSHFPGLDYFFIVFVVLLSGLLTIIQLIKYVMTKNNYYKAALLIHGVFFCFILLLIYVGYY